MQIIKKNHPALGGFVPWAGIEPAHPKILDFESSASTSSATKAAFNFEEAKVKNNFVTPLKEIENIFFPF